MADLGDEVKDKVTGFKGVVTSKTFFLNGCIQVGISAPLTKDGKMGESWNIDESQIEVTVTKKVKVKEKSVGGPSTRLR